MRKVERASYIEEKLSSEFGPLGPTLCFKNDRECLIAILLSAQTTDISVNKVTPSLWKRYPTFASFAESSVEEIEGYIHSLGLYKNKAKSLFLLGKIFKERGEENIPHDFSFLVSLPGVGEKTAGVFLIERDKAISFPVDTHIFRVTHRLALQKEKTPSKAGEKLFRLYPKEKASYMHRAFITLGRRFCKAQKPLCKHCPLQEICPSYFSFFEK